MRNALLAGPVAALSTEAPAFVGLTAVTLAERLESGDVLYIASNEPRAEALAAALAIAAPDALVVQMPSSDALPGDSAPASAANIGRRVAALRALRGRGDARAALIVTAEAAAQLYPRPAAFEMAPPEIKLGDALDLNAFAEDLRAIGYADDDEADELGMLAVRGHVVDVFPADAGQPARIEVDAERGRVVNIRSFDPVTQLTTATLDRLYVGHAHEPPLGDAPVSLFDHLPGAAIGFDPDAAARRDRYIALVDEARRTQPGLRVAVADAATWDAALAAREVIAPGQAEPMPRFVEGRSPLRALAHAAKAALADGATVVIAGTPRDVRFIGTRLGKALKLDHIAAGSWREVAASPPGALLTLPMPIDHGWRTSRRFVLAAADLLGSRAQRDAGPVQTHDPLHSSAGVIHVGEVVIHEDFGVAVVIGLEPLAGTGAAANGGNGATSSATLHAVPAGDAASTGEALELEFADGGRRQVAVADADRIWRYGAEADAVTLDKLDGSSWAKRRAGIDVAIAETARGLTELAAARGARTTAAIAPDSAAYERFAAGFGYTETADQARAIAAVRADLAGGKPADRLVVGDVGYGKTEVALRAAALAVLAGRQVAVAAPTTVLVRQHLEVFRKRFADSGIVIAGLSRLSSAAEKKATRAGLADGSIGIVIGTAAVAGKGVDYHDLALVIIDEEQRFGAADKAKLRNLCEGCHILTLTATPIPRTLQTALVGLQELSLITTPPARRQPIRTSAGAFEPVRVRTALLREKARGGQSFVVVPRIEDMAGMREQLMALVPELSCREAHGKLAPAEIDEAMVKFAGGDGDVLLATNIIEAGLDVPRANTMLVWRAGRFGLAQLHQLRGRVGRGSRRGQILLLTDPAHEIAPRTLKRLQTLETFDRLGAGFDISARDLDVRGAGDLLGDTQAGHVKLIGVDLYHNLLEAALRTARGETVEYWTPELNLGVAGCLPEDWIPEVDVRLPLYTRLAQLTTVDAVDHFEAELEDRFGALPAPAATLLAVARARLHARAARILRIDAGPAAIALTPRAGFTADAGALGLVTKGERLLLAERIDDVTARLERVTELVDAFEHS